MMIITSELIFERRERIGGLEGANSEVYTAYDQQLGAELVVKMVPIADFEDPDGFFSEARMLYDARHPNVVEIKYACRDQDMIYLAMPRYEQGSMHALLRQRHLTVREIVKYATDFLSGLHHIHTKGLVHFDVKPTNVLLDSSGRAAVTDFGLTKYVDADGLADQPRFYVSHLPPEVFEATQRGAESDIYQAALTLYRMCNGLDKFEEQWDALGARPAQFAAIQAGTFPDRRAYLPHIPNRMRTAINKAMEPDPDLRHSEILGLLNDLALVDDWLDWRYERDGDVERWELHADTHVKRIERREHGGGWSIACTKTNYESGRTQRANALSVEVNTRHRADRAVQRALTEL